MVIFLDAKRGVRATVVIGEAAPIRAGRGTCLDGVDIVAAARNLYGKLQDFFWDRREIC
jgi:hypothetical protein